MRRYKKMGVVTIRRAKTGNVETYDTSGGKPRLVSERTAGGKSVARILVQPTKSGLGIKSSKPVSTQSQVRLSREVQSIQEKVNVASKQLKEAPPRVIGIVDPNTERLRNITLMTRDNRILTPEAYQRKLISKRERLKKLVPASELAKEKLIGLKTIDLRDKAKIPEIRKAEELKFNKLIQTPIAKKKGFNRCCERILTFC